MAEERQKNPDDEHLPGEVSDQNAEEQPTEHGEQAATRRRPPAKSRGDKRSGGESKEGSQSTGSPSSAG